MMPESDHLDGVREAHGGPPSAPMDSLPRPFGQPRRSQTDQSRQPMGQPPGSTPGGEDAANTQPTESDTAPSPEDLEQLRQRFLAAALSAPLSNDAVSGRLLQALPQISIGQFLQDLNNQTPPWRGFAPSRQTSLDAHEGGGLEAGGDSETGRLLPPQPHSPTRSRRRSSGSSIYSMSTTGEIERGGSTVEESNTTQEAGNATPAPTRPRRNTDEEMDDQTAMNELQSLFRRCHNSLPFVALFLIYFAYQHATGILVFVVGTVAVMGLDQRLRVQVALKDKANMWHLLGIIAMCVIDMVAICSVDGEPNPLHHLSRILHSRSTTHGSGSDNGLWSGGVFWQVLWTVLVNDFLVRLWSIVLKAFVAGAKSERFHCERKTQDQGIASEQTSSPATVDVGEENSAATTPLTSQTTSSASFYRRKRKLYGLIEMSSIFLRSLLASVPWCSFYQLCASKFMADVFTFAYLFVKGLILATQGKRIFVLTRSLIKLGLEFGSYVSHDELVEAGSPDCSICYETMRQPVKLPCSHMFCEECVTEWFDHERSCPLCRASVGSPGNNDDENVKPQFLDGRTSLVPQLL